MNSDNFVIYENEGKIMSGGYVINSQNMISNLSNLTGGRKKNNSKKNDVSVTEPMYAMPAGLIVIEINKSNDLPVREINYSPKNVLDDDIFDVFYESATISSKNDDNLPSVKNNKSNKSQKKITRKNIKNKHVGNKKTRSNKKH